MIEISVNLSSRLRESFTSSKIYVIELIVKGYTNQRIAEALNIKVKSVEAAIADICRNLKIDSSYYYPRMRILAYLLANDLIDYPVDQSPEILIDFNDDLNATLVLVSAGLSNLMIAKIFELSDKTIEHRLSQLFDYMGVETKQMNIENPRILLIVSALKKRNLSISKIKTIFRDTAPEKFARILEEPKYFASKLAVIEPSIG